MMKQILMQEKIKIQNAGNKEASFTVPVDAKDGTTIHIILKLKMQVLPI